MSRWRAVVIRRAVATMTRMGGAIVCALREFNTVRELNTGGSSRPRRFTRILVLMFCGLGMAAQAQVPKDDAASWTRFDDPNEHAFAIDVPAGWKVEGGLVRRGPVDLSMFLRALSPDGSILLILGDPAPAYFGTPGLG